jgi:hypothetical protein
LVPSSACIVDKERGHKGLNQRGSIHRPHPVLQLTNPHASPFSSAPHPSPPSPSSPSSALRRRLPLDYCCAGFSAVLFALKVVLNHDSPAWESIMGVPIPSKVRGPSSLRIPCHSGGLLSSRPRVQVPSMGRAAILALQLAPRPLPTPPLPALPPCPSVPWPPFLPPVPLLGRASAHQLPQPEGLLPGAPRGHRRRAPAC